MAKKSGGSISAPDTGRGNIAGGAYNIVLLAEPGGISFEYSSCPDQTCVRTGKLTRAGQAAVCLPARISVRLEGGEQAADAMTG